jgi:hypothetical protein
MALIFLDSVEHYSVATDKYENVNGTATVSVSAVRSGSKGLLISQNNQVRKTVPALATYIAGCAFRLPTTPGNGAPGGTSVIAFGDTGTIQIIVGIDQNGFIKVRNSSTALGTSVSPIPGWGINQWHYMEVKGKVDPTVGTVEVRIDGAVVISLTGVNTRSSANSYANQIWFGDAWNSGAVHADDIYICDTTGTYNNNYLGDVKVTCLTPNGAGAFTQFALTGAANNFSAVNELPYNDDTSYVSDATVGDRDSYAFTDITLTGNIWGIMVWARARKDDAGTRQLSVSARSSGTDLFGPTFSVASSYAYYSTIYETDPNTSLPWTVAGLNAAEFGLKVIA